MPPLDIGRLGSELLTASEIRAAPVASPQRSFLAWWRDVQYVNLSGYLDGLAPAVRQRRARRRPAEQDLGELGPALRNALPWIIGVHVNGDRALLVVEVHARQPLRAYRYRIVVSTPQAVRLARIGGRWRLADGAFLRGWLAEG